jgi:hypothetical protein
LARGDTIERKAKKTDVALDGINRTNRMDRMEDGTAKYAKYANKLRLGALRQDC